MRGSSAYTAVSSGDEEESPPIHKRILMRQLSPTLWDHRKKQIMMMPKKQAVQLRPLEASSIPIKNEFLNAEHGDDISRLTDDFRTLKEVESALEMAIEMDREECSRDLSLFPQMRISPARRSNSTITPAAAPAAPGTRQLRSDDCFTFRRRIGRVIRETTVRADSEEETMKEIVTRLQHDKGDRVLRFSKETAKAIKGGDKLIHFSLVQLPNVKFSKEAFGELTASEALDLTAARPLVLEILLEDSIEGEDLVIF